MRRIILTSTPLLFSIACGGGDGSGTGTETETETETATETETETAAEGDTTAGDGTSSSSTTGDDTSTDDTTTTTGDGDGDDDTETDDTGDTGVPTCGDGNVDPGEACDDGNSSNEDDCLDTCEVNVCGDGFVNPATEACDAGEANNDLSGPCRSDCSFCECQGTNPPPGTSCADVGASCGTLGCDGCNFDVSACITVDEPTLTGVPGPQFPNGECWFQCEGWTDSTTPDELPTNWGANCDDTDFSRMRIACGINEDVYRYIDVEKNVFTFLLAANPELGLISTAADQDGTPFVVAENAVYAEGMPPLVPSGTSWFGGNADCLENSTNLSVKNELCMWEVAGCFGQNIAGDRNLWVYVAP